MANDARLTKVRFRGIAWSASSLRLIIFFILLAIQVVLARLPVFPCWMTSRTQDAASEGEFDPPSRRPKKDHTKDVLDEGHFMSPSMRNTSVVFSY